MSGDIPMDTFWSFGSLELESWKQRAETGESENSAFGMPPGNANGWNAGIFVSLCL